MKAKKLTRIVLFALSGAGFACGFEPLLGRVTAEDHPTPDGGSPPQPQSAIVKGSVPQESLQELNGADLTFQSSDGLQLSPTVVFAGEEFTATFPAGEQLTGVLVVVQRGTIALRSLVAEIVPGQTVMAADFDGIDNRETAGCLLLQAKAAALGRTLGSFPAGTLTSTWEDVLQKSDQGEILAFFEMVQRVSACTACNRGTAPRFRTPVVTASGMAIESALHPDFIWANPIDLDGDNQPEDTTEKFDAALAAALPSVQFKACYCDEPDYFAACGYQRPQIPVVFAVDFSAGTKDGNCDPIDRFLWAEDRPGAKMFFAGGIHDDSPSSLRDDSIEQMLGAWVPNLVPMFDDGTHGDERAGDGVWTTWFLLPVGLKVGYKYTWGLQGDPWGGTEEWPGNRRILEVADVNGDHVVARVDEFGDETTNKDLMNRLLPKNGGKGTVNWETDANGDGIADAKERKVDRDYDCILDDWWTPTKVTPATTPCP